MIIIIIIIINNNNNNNNSFICQIFTSIDKSHLHRQYLQHMSEKPFKCLVTKYLVTNHIYINMS